MEGGGFFPFGGDPEEILRGLLGSDVVGFQEPTAASNFRRLARQIGANGRGISSPAVLMSATAEHELYGCFLWTLAGGESRSGVSW